MKVTLIILVISSLLFFCCSSKQNDKNKIYFVIKHLADTTVDNKDTDRLPSPPTLLPLFYGNYNFILVDTSKVFYHIAHMYYFCGTGIDHTKPPRLNLTLDSIKEVGINNLNQFLLSLPDNSKTIDRIFFATISSPTDTIKNRAYQIITDFFKKKKFTHARFSLLEKNSLINYNVRNWTEEEKYVITAKINKTKYDPNKVEWNEGFDIEFVSPIKE